MSDALWLTVTMGATIDEVLVESVHLTDDEARATGRVVMPCVRGKTGFFRRPRAGDTLKTKATAMGFVAIAPLTTRAER